MTDRRNALKVLTGVAATTAVGAVSVPALGLVAAPAMTGARPAGSSRDAAGPAGEGWTVVARFEDLAQAQATQVPVMGSEEDAWTVTPDRRIGAVWLIRDGESPASLRAFSAACPHLGCLIERAGERFTCPCHTASFDAQGRRLGGPAPRGMDPLEVRVVDGQVAVRYVRFRLGVAQRVPG